MTSDDGDLVTVDTRNRVTLGSAAVYTHYLMTVADDNTITLRPAAILPVSMIDTFIEDPPTSTRSGQPDPAPEDSHDGHRCDRDCPPVGVGDSVPTGEIYHKWNPSPLFMGTATVVHGCAIADACVMSDVCPYYVNCDARRSPNAPGGTETP